MCWMTASYFFVIDIFKTKLFESLAIWLSLCIKVILFKLIKFFNYEKSFLNCIRHEFWKKTYFFGKINGRI